PVHEIFIDRSEGRETLPEFGTLFWVFLVYAVSYISASILFTLWKLRTAPQNKRAPLAWVLVGLVSFVAAGLADVYYNVIVYPQYGIVPGLTSLGLLLITLCFSFIFYRNGWMNQCEVSFIEEIREKNV